MKHAELVTRAEKWLRNKGKCKFAFTELGNLWSGETPDAIGFSFQGSTLIECKSTRGDFLADKKKRFRQEPNKGMGFSRYFMCEKGLINPGETPPGWGLIWVIGSKTRIKTPSTFHDMWTTEDLHRMRITERYLLVSALNRFKIRLRGDFGMIYDIDWTPVTLQEMKARLKGWSGWRYWGSI